MTRFGKIGFVVVLAALLAGGCGSMTHPPRPASARAVVVELPQGRLSLDLYLPPTPRPAPLVVVAHGWTRSKDNMSGWGDYLAKHGFVVAVPTLPTWSDHSRNGRAVAQLVEHLKDHPPEGANIDGSRIGLLGYSAGGLATFLAAAQSPNVKLWIGLDPVELRGLGVAAAPNVRCPCIVLRAEPKGWNHNGNWTLVEDAAPSLWQARLRVNNATHADCEWPNDPATEWTCGQFDAQRQEIFKQYVITSLRANLLGDRDARQILSDAGSDARVQVLSAAPQRPI